MNNVLALQKLSSDEVEAVETESKDMAAGGQEADVHYGSHVSLLLCHDF